MILTEEFAAQMFGAYVAHSLFIGSLTLRRHKLFQDKLKQGNQKEALKHNVELYLL